MSRATYDVVAPRADHWIVLAVVAAGAGLLIALSVPPAGFWPLGLFGVGILGAMLAGQPLRQRALVGFCGGMGLYAVTIWWFTEFNFIGAVLSMMVEAAFLAGAAAITPPRRGRMVGWIGALVLQDWLRTYIPFGGVPLGGIPLGQAAGPLAPVARLGGQLAVTGVVAMLGVSLEALVRLGLQRRVRLWWGAATLPAVVSIALIVAGRMAPSGHQVGTMRVAAVQGGGKRGLRAIHSSSQLVYEAQLSETQHIKPPVDLILWPEDVIALEGPIAGTAVAAQVGQIAHSPPRRVPRRRHRGHRDRPVPQRRGRVGRHRQDHRPLRQGAPGARSASTSPAARSSSTSSTSTSSPGTPSPGHGTGEVQTQAGPVGIVISFEVFFPARARSAINAGRPGPAGARPTPPPTRTTQVPAAEVAARRSSGRGRRGATWSWRHRRGGARSLDAAGHLLQRSRLGSRPSSRRPCRGAPGSRRTCVRGDAPSCAVAGPAGAPGWRLARRKPSGPT